VINNDRVNEAQRAFNAPALLPLPAVAYY